MLVDTSLLIDYFRKKEKGRTVLHGLAKVGHGLCISAVTEYELYVGATEDQHAFWDELLRRMTVRPLGSAEVRRAASIQAGLKRQRKQLALPDLFIAATAWKRHCPWPR
ncbi:MAG: type II toxin-antitoxin system VapC family toxin [Flavobacteriales bacterium]|nr:type II toxin-antitoxin system VapC family toxin [Flavobacteriales bacterium]